MFNTFDQVGMFHQKFDLPVAAETTAKIGGHSGIGPRLMNVKEFEYRTNFLFEELREFIEAHGRSDLASAADALADLVWIALGTAHYMGIPFEQVWKEVFRANMEKRPWRDGDPVKPRNTKGMEVVKPDGWVPPNIFKVIDEALETEGVKKV